jgi:hypothetical protein
MSVPRCEETKLTRGRNNAQQTEILMGGEGSYYTSTFVFFVTDGRKKTTTTTFGAVNNNNSVCDAFHSKTQESKSTRDWLKLRAAFDKGPMKSSISIGQKF